MKKLVYLFVSLFLVVVAAENVNAQANSATVLAASTSANIIATITLANTTPLAFGNIIAGTGGTVVISPDGGRTSTDGVTLQNAVPGTAAVFGVTGLDGAAYSITLPAANVILTHTDGSTTMTIDKDTFTHSVDGTPTIGTNNSFNVGATLTVASAQTAGAYNGTYSVTVTYN